MFKLDLEKAEEPEINCQHPLDNRKIKNSRRTSTSASLSTLKPLTVWITTNWKILQDMRTPDYLAYHLKNLYAGQEATVRNWTWNIKLVLNWERSMSRLYVVTLLI